MQRKSVFVLAVVIILAALNIGLYASYEFRRTKDGEIDFYSVLDVLVTRFVQDLNDIDSNIQKISNYKISLQGELPESFKDDLRNRLYEAVTHKSRLKMVKCVPCFKTLITTEEQQLVVRQGIHQMEDLQKIAQNLGVRIFMESDLSYQPNEMVLSVSLFDAYRGEVIWSRRYSSKDSRTVKKSQQEKSEEEARAKTSNYRMNIAPGLFYLPGEGDIFPKINYTGLSASLLEFLGGTWDRFGITLSGFIPPLLRSDRKAVKSIIEGGGMLEFRLYMNLGGEKFRQSLFLGGGPLFSSNYQSFIAGLGHTLEIGKKFGLTGSLFYLLPAKAYLEEDKIELVKGSLNFNKQNNEVKVQGIGLNLAFMLQW